MLQVFVIFSVLLLWFIAAHWIHPRLTSRRHSRGGREPGSREGNLPRVEDQSPAAVTSRMHFPAHHSIRDLDQGRKLEVGR